MTDGVSLLVWRVPTGRLPLALWRVATGRGRLRRQPGVRFVKLLGTGRGRLFGPTHPDLTRWAAIVVHDATTEPDRMAEVARWDGIATARLRLDLAPLAVRGAWAGRQPFPAEGRPVVAAVGRSPGGVTGPVLALTRARLRPSRTVRFWRAVAPAAAAAHRADGLLAAFGVGEAPIGWQGTVTVWRSARDLVEFAYRHPAHRRVIEETSARRWYAEELFARFAVTQVHGDREVIGWTGVHRERTELDA